MVTWNLVFIKWLRVALIFTENTIHQMQKNMHLSQLGIHTIFSIGISISTLAIMAMITIIFGEKRKAISDAGAGRIWGYVNLISYALGILSVAYTFVLAFLPWPEFSPFHGIVARSMFAYGVMWCVIQMVLEWKLGHKFPRYCDELKKRALPVLAVVIGLTGFAYFFAKLVELD